MNMQNQPRAMRTTIRVISLATDQQRRAAFQERARGATLPWSYFDACTNLAPDITYDEDLAIVCRGRPLTRAELGCFSSHYSLWQELLAGGADQVIVLEDDVLVDWVYLQRVAEHDFSANGIQYLRLASTATPPSIYKGELLGRYLVHFLGYALGVQAYLLTRTGAKHLVERMRCVRAPVDDMLDQSWRGSLPNFGLYQHPVISAEGPSHIGAARNAPYVMPARLKWRRLWHRVEEKLRSRSYRLAMRLGFGPPVRGVESRWI
jgi:glycosyl transferase, family 25